MSRVKILLTVGTLLLTIGMIGVYFTYGIDYETVSEEVNLDKEQFNSIDVDTRNAEIDIIATDDVTAKMELSGKKLKTNQIDYQVNVKGNTLFTDLKEQQKKIYNFDFGTTTLHLKLYLPEKKYQAVQVNNENGKIKMNHVHAKEINATSENGRLETEGLMSSTIMIAINNGQINGKDITTEDMEVTSNNGKIDLSQVDATASKIETDNGQINLKDITGDVVGTAKNGKISLTTADLEKSIELKTDNGKIDVQTKKKPQNVEFIVSIQNGKVDILGEYHESTVFGNGDHLVKLTTNNGKITVH